MENENEITSMVHEFIMQTLKEYIDVTVMPREGSVDTIVMARLRPTRGLPLHLYKEYNVFGAAVDISPNGLKQYELLRQITESLTHTLMREVLINKSGKKAKKDKARKVPVRQ